MNVAIYHPRQTVLVTSRAVTEIMGKSVNKDNAMAVDWHTPLSQEPFLYAIALAKNRFSLKLIRKSGVFAVNFMPFDLWSEVLCCGRQSGCHVDKLGKTGLTFSEAERIDCPVIAEALAYMECETVNEFEGGDHVMIIGKVVNSRTIHEGRRILHMGGAEFTTVN
ncbi:MAG: flavin reductase family protein [archaeon]